MSDTENRDKTEVNANASAVAESNTSLLSHFGGRPRHEDALTLTGFEQATRVAQQERRFHYQLTLNEIAAQQDNRARLLSQTVLPKFEVKDEDQFEDWVDSASLIIKRSRLSTDLMHEAWIATASIGDARILQGINQVETHEQLVDSVAKALCFKGRGIYKLRNSLLNPNRCSSAREARAWVEQRLARLYRWCVRWNTTFTISDVDLFTIARKCMPSALADDNKRNAPRNQTWEEMWERAAEQEEWMVEEYGKIPQHMGGFQALEATASDPNRDVNMSSGNDGKKAKTTFKKMPTQMCGRCMRGVHWARDCIFINHRCAKCHMIGHISEACRNMVDKDAKGRVETSVQLKPSQTVTKHRKDRTQTEKMSSAQQTMEDVATKHVTKQKKAAAKRKEKNKDKPRKRKEVEHPTMVAEEAIPSSSSEGSSETESESSADEKERTLHPVLVASVKATIFKTDATINNIKTIVGLDTCASYSLVSTEEAKRLNITKDESNKERLFNGLGDLKGFLSKLCEVQIGPKKLNMPFWIMQKPQLQTVIGLSELESFNINLHIKQRQVVDCDTGEVIAQAYVSEDSTNIEMDRVTQRPIGSSDEELLKHGVEIIQEKTMHLSNKAQQQVIDLFVKYQSVWLKPKAAQATKHTAKFVVEGPPVKMKARPIAAELKKELDIQLDDMLANGVISPSKSNWAGVPVFAKKKDNTWRLCLDFRLLNKQMKQDLYPLPLLWEQIQRAAGHKYYSTFDLNWGFWNLPLDPESRKYTALTTHRGLFEFNIIPFGIKNSPAEFQRMMDKSLEHLAQHNVSWYIDDIITYADTKCQLLKQMEMVLKAMVEGGLYIKLKKLTLMQDHALALGHIINRFGLRPNPQKVQGIKDAKTPTNLTELRGFLGSVNFLRKYIPHCSEKQEALTELLRKGTKFEMDERRVNTFNELNSAITDQTLLAAPRGSDGFTILCDASEVGLGAVLMQRQNNEDVPLEFASKSLNKAERNWPAYEREAYAIRWSVQKFQDYIKINGATILTDHRSLEWMLKAESGKLRRWALFLQQFSLTIKYIKGTDNVIADWLSRSLPEDDPFNDDEETAIPQFTAVSQSPTSPVNSENYIIKHCSLIPHLPSYQQIKRETENMKVEDELHRTTYVGTDGVRYSIKSHKLYIPPVYRAHFIYWMHASRYGGHAGINRTTKRITKWLWWPNVKETVANFINGCMVCLQHKPIQKAVSLSGVLSKSEPLELISIDCVGPRQWNHQKMYYICIIDHCSRFMMLKSADHKPGSADIINMLKQNWLPVFQMPYAVLTDRGTEFTATETVEFLMNNVGCAIVKTSPYYPQGNSINEAAHRTINTTLSLLKASGEEDFEECVQLAATLHNCCPHKSTNQTPYFLLFGFEPTLPGWQGIQQQNKDLSSRFILRKQEQMQATYRRLLEKEKQTTIVKDKNILVDDWIIYQLSEYEKSAAGDSSKYSPHWSLPAKVKEVKQESIIIETWYERERQVPLSLVYKLRGEVHPSLEPLNLKQLQIKVKPRFGTVPLTGPPQTWNNFLENAKDQQPLPESNTSGNKKTKRNK